MAKQDGMGLDLVARPVDTVFWYLGDRQLNFVQHRKVEIGNDVRDNETLSTLTLENVAHEDAGNYTCGAPWTKSGSVIVFVSAAGESQASIQRRKTASTSFDTIGRMKPDDLGPPPQVDPAPATASGTDPVPAIPGLLFCLLILSCSSQSIHSFYISLILIPHFYCSIASV
ncbi:unnamed protein product [Cyprideis torosa]|uniref:Uncharacterized protein n=1 Tax=Cyprideis torosa TaxID=163714 RepID=A0A7R8WDY8_9CRUS|nr:unnamed protein product [Cyprideis torosa]CAG0890115.1 unnamed protein product [Cyprideis torosa]